MNATPGDHTSSTRRGNSFSTPPTRTFHTEPDRLPLCESREARYDGHLQEAIQAVIMDVAITHGTVCADDVRHAMPNAPRKRSLFGSAFRTLEQQGRLQCVGYQPSTHPDNHGRRIKQYRPTHHAPPPQGVPA